MSDQGVTRAELEKLKTAVLEMAAQAGADPVAAGIRRDLDGLLRAHQKQRGFTEYFAEGDTVWFPGGWQDTKSVPFTVARIYANGVAVASPEGFEQQHLDGAVIRLGMTHTPPASHG
jgi:hypothetical protein